MSDQPHWKEPVMINPADLKQPDSSAAETTCQ